MSMVQVGPGLLGALVGVLLSVIAWNIWKTRDQAISSTLFDVQGNLLLWLLILAAFALGAFVTYLLLRL
jgi:hypothetical protein